VPFYSPEPKFLPSVCLLIPLSILKIFKPVPFQNSRFLFKIDAKNLSHLLIKKRAKPTQTSHPHRPQRNPNKHSTQHSNVAQKKICHGNGRHPSTNCESREGNSQDGEKVVNLSSNDSFGHR
jgi:hypothetical protein